MSRSVLVTGGNRGIGRAIAQAFLDAGDNVAITYRSGEPPEGFLAVQCDVTDAAAVEAAFVQIEEKQGPVEVLVANAGITDDTCCRMRRRLGRRDPDEPDRVVPGREARREGRTATAPGRIVLVSSVVGLLGSAGQVNYAASKSGLVGMARSIARELGSRGITANVVAPGFVDTDMTAELPDDLKKQYIGQIPLGRFTTSDEIAGVVRWIASDEAGYITGAVIPVDSGLGMGH